MVLKFAVSTAVVVLLSSAAASSWAQKGKKKDSAEVVPDSINRQFQWEEKVVGPKDKGVDHRKIAALQEQARREEEAKRKEPQQPKKVERAAGIDAPATASIPTQDIEKPAAAPAKKPVKRAAYEEPRRRDALDNLLTQETGKSDGFSDRSNNGLNSLFGSEDKPQSRHVATKMSSKKGKKPPRRR